MVEDSPPPGDGACLLSRQSDLGEHLPDVGTADCRPTSESAGIWVEGL